MDKVPRALGPRALALVEEWEANRTRLVTAAEIRAAMGPRTTDSAARWMTTRLRHKGFLETVRRGVYAVQPLAWMGNKAVDVAASVAALSSRGVKYYVGFDTAAGHYGWNPESYGVVTVAIPSGSQVRMPEVEGSRVRAVRVSERTFSIGVRTETWRGQVVPMSTRELTMVDAVSRVKLVGGYPGCLRLLARARADVRVDAHEVARIARAHKSTRLLKRLGWLTERAGWKWSESDLAVLRGGWSKNNRVTLADRRAGPPGRWDSRWEMIINVPDDQLQPEVGIR
jgi:predicted transcriptional regulator of viral defense system